MTGTLLYLVRHAESAPSREVAEPHWPLSPRGVLQANELVSTLLPLGISQVVSSPYRRAMATLEPFAATTGTTIQIEPDLRERKLTHAPAADWQRLLERAWREPAHAEPDAESNIDCQERVLACLTRTAKRLEGHVIVAASHGNAIALMLNSIDPGFGYEQWRAMKNPDCFTLRYEQRRWHWLRD